MFAQEQWQTFCLLRKVIISSSLWVCGSALAPRVSSLIQEHSFRDAEPHPVITPNAKQNHRIFPIQLRPGINTSLITTNICLPSTEWQCSVVCYYGIHYLGPRNEREILFGINFPCLAVWLCLKMGSKNIVLVWLLQIGAKDLTVSWIKKMCSKRIP